MHATHTFPQLVCVCLLASTFAVLGWARAVQAVHSDACFTLQHAHLACSPCPRAGLLHLSPLGVTTRVPCWTPSRGRPRRHSSKHPVRRLRQAEEAPDLILRRLPLPLKTCPRHLCVQPLAARLSRRSSARSSSRFAGAWPRRAMIASCLADVFGSSLVRANICDLIMRIVASLGSR